MKVPCGRLVASGHEDSLLEYNEYAVYDPKQVMTTALKESIDGQIYFYVCFRVVIPSLVVELQTSIRFLVEVKFEEKGEAMQ